MTLGGSQATCDICHVVLINALDVRVFYVLGGNNE